METFAISDPEADNATSESQFKTPQKPGTVTATSCRHSPPVSPCLYLDSDQMCETLDEAETNDEAATDAPPKRGTTYASPVIKNRTRALKVLACVLGEMHSSPLNYVPAHQRDFLYVVQKGALGGYEKLEHGLDFYKGQMSRSNVQKLYLLEELGHGHHGRVYVP